MVQFAISQKRQGKKGDHVSMEDNNVKEKKHFFHKKEKKTEVAEVPKKKKKVWLIVLIIAAIVIVLIGSAVKNMTSQIETAANMVEVEPVEKRDLSDSVSLKGTIAGQSKTNVMSLAAAEITAVNVQVGDIVKEGDPLVTLDQKDIEKQIAELKTNINNANAVAANDEAQKQNSLTQNKQDQQDALDAAQKTIDKAQADVDKSSLETAQNALDSANDNYASVLKNTDRSVASAQNTVDMQKYQTSTTRDLKDQLEQLQKQLADCTLSAPIGGVVTAVNVSVGDKNTAGTTMITIEDTSSLKVIVNVEEADILKIQEGMPATVSTDATGDEEIKGTVTRVVRVKNQSTNTNGTDTNTSSGYSAEITIDNTELLVGMSAKAKIVIKDRGTQLAVPYDLIRQDDNGDSYVLVAEANEDGTATAVRKNIKVGEEVDYYTEVTGGDLKEGDQLIYDNTFSVTEGQVFTPEQIYSNQALDTEGMMSTEAE